jgi:hypothetical protein
MARATSTTASTIQPQGTELDEDAVGAVVVVVVGWLVVVVGRLVGVRWVVVVTPVVVVVEGGAVVVVVVDDVVVVVGAVVVVDSVWATAEGLNAPLKAVPIGPNVRTMLRSPTACRACRRGRVREGGTLTGGSLENSGRFRGNIGWAEVTKCPTVRTVVGPIFQLCQHPCGAC